MIGKRGSVNAHNNLIIRLALYMSRDLIMELNLISVLI